MLVLKRKEGQWTEIVHRSGDVLRIRLYDIQATPEAPRRANLAFDDSDRNFEIRRPERIPMGGGAEPFDPFAFRLQGPPGRPSLELDDGRILADEDLAAYLADHAGPRSEGPDPGDQAVS